MIRHYVLTLAFFLFAGPALALSCMRPDAVRMFEYARQSDDVYYLIKGRITPVGDYDVPEIDHNAPTPHKDVFADTPIQIEGIGLGERGFSVPVDVSAIARIGCLSVWCAGAPSAEELLMIVKRDRNDLVLEVGPCGGTTIPWSKEAEDRLLACHVSNTCDPGEF